MPELPPVLVLPLIGFPLALGFPPVCAIAARAFKPAAADCLTDEGTGTLTERAGCGAAKAVWVGIGAWCG